MSQFVIADNAPIYSVTEYFYLKVHEESIAGPFPDSTVAVVYDGYKTCYRDDLHGCYLKCTGYGNDVDSVKIYKEDIDGGDRTLLPTEAFGHGQGTLEKSVIMMDTRSMPDKQTIVCEATLKNGGKKEYSFVYTVMDTRP